MLVGRPRYYERFACFLRISPVKPKTMVPRKTMLAGSGTATLEIVKPVSIVPSAFQAWHLQKSETAFGFRIAPDTLSSEIRRATGSRSVLAVSGFRLRARLDFSIPSCSPGQRGITPAFGYSAPHPSAEGTSTPMIHALPSAHYARHDAAVHPGARDRRDRRGNRDCRPAVHPNPGGRSRVPEELRMSARNEGPTEAPARSLGPA